MTGSQVAHGTVVGLLAGGEPPAPGENPGGDGLAGLIAAALEWAGRPAALGALGVLVFLAGGAWMWSGAPKSTGEEGRRIRRGASGH